MGSFSAIAPIEEVEASASTSNTDPITAESAQIITQSGRIVDFYSEFGLDETDFPAASAVVAAVLEGVIDLVFGSPTPPAPLPPSRPTDCSDTGALIAYAERMALTNSARDANAGTSDAETVYMYMSHFFDLPSMCADPTAYYPDWITNSDRTAYNNYISASNNTALIANVGQMSLSAKSLVDAPIAGFQKIVRGEAGDRLIGLAQVGDKVLAAKSLIDARVALGSLAEEGKTPQQIVDQVRTNLSSTWTDWNSAGVIIGTMAALMTPGVGAAVFGLGAVAVSMQLTGITTLFQTAAYNALRYTTSSRASGRFMRSLGW